MEVRSSSINNDGSGGSGARSVRASIQLQWLICIVMDHKAATSTNVFAQRWKKFLAADKMRHNASRIGTMLSAAAAAAPDATAVVAANDQAIWP